MSTDPIHVACLIAHSPDADLESLRAFVHQLEADVAPVLEEATGVPWRFHTEEPTRIGSDDPRRPSDFLDEASLRMVEGPYDGVAVITDVALVSRGHRVAPGLASRAARVAVLSTRPLRLSPRGEPTRSLGSAAARWNGGALLMHLLGHLLGLGHRPPEDGSVMSPFRMVAQRRELPAFDTQSLQSLRRSATEFPEREHRESGWISEIAFHLSSAARHARTVAVAVWRSRGPFLPLHLPRLSTAAVAPAVILVFTAEIWDAGFHMTGPEVWLFAALSILGSTAYLAMAQDLFLPRREKRLHTEHLAVVNVAIVLVLFTAVTGLFVLLIGLMLVVQIFIFPPDLIREWPSLALGPANIGLADQIRIAALISTIGVLTGALAGGLESRTLLRHLALFDSDP